MAVLKVCKFSRLAVRFPFLISKRKKVLVMLHSQVILQFFLNKKTILQIFLEIVDVLGGYW